MTQQRTVKTHAEELAGLRGRYEYVPDDDHYLQLSLDYETGDWSLNEHHKSETGTPREVWYGHAGQMQIDATPYDEFEAWMESPAISTLRSRIVSGYSTEWDGQNLIGTFDADGEEAREEFCRSIDERDYPTFPEDEGHFYYADQWLQHEQPDVPAETTDDELSELAQEYELEALRQGAVVSGLYDYLKQQREDAAC